MKNIRPLITHLLPAAFLVLLFGLAINLLPALHGQPLSKKAINTAAARQAASRADVLFLRALTWPVSVPTVCTLNGTLGTAPAGGDTGNLGVRLFRPGVATTCASAPYPGTTGAGPYPYNVHYITNNTAAPICTMVTLHYVSGGTPTVNFQVGAFLAPFAAADISNAARYLGDPGSSSGNPPLDTSVSVNIPAGAMVGLVVWNTNASQGTGAVYQINLDQDLFCGPPAPIIAAAGSMITAEGCAPPNGAIDPGETVTVSFKLMNNGSLATTNLVATLLPGGGVTLPSGPQNYGIIAPGGMASGSFSFTADSALSCGGTITATFQLSDNGNPLPNVTFNLITGILVPSFSQNFDGVVAPALPAGWTSTASGIGVPWVTSTTTPNSAPNEAFSPDGSNIGDSALVTPVIAIPAAGATLTFQNSYNTESTYDGAVLEISINGGAFNDIIAAGGTFVSGGYNATINTAFMSPIAGRMAWSGDSGGYVNTAVTLPAAANGQNVQFQWRMASDSSVSVVGVMIDDVALVSPVCCSASAPVLASAVSRLTHGGAGDFSVPLPLTGTAGVEDRSSATYNIVLTFNNGPITSGTASVTAGTGTAGAPTFNGGTMTVPLTGVANAQTLTLTVNNVSAAGEGTLPSASVNIGFLIGDTGGNGSVNSADVGQTKAQSGNAVTGSNFREDVNHDGNVNASDVGLVKSKSGTSIP